jgi:hypothetical protein
MGRRADPERIYQAGRAAIRNRLVSTGMDAETAERWLTSWELEAATRQMPTTGDFWTVGDAWIAEQRAARRRPTT